MDVEEFGPACFVEDGPAFFLRVEEAEPFAPVVPWTPPATVRFDAGISSGAKKIIKTQWQGNLFCGSSAPLYFFSFLVFVACKC